jgi:hypothetical protein
VTFAANSRGKAGRLKSSEGNAGRLTYEASWPEGKAGRLTG